MALSSEVETTLKRKNAKASGLSHKRRKKNTLNVPTAEEMEKLWEAENEFHSGLFKMQIEELLKELRSKLNEKEKLDEWLKKLQDFLFTIPITERVPIKDFTLNSSVVIPIVQKPESDKGVFKFAPPKALKKVGSYVTDTMCASEPVVDVALEIPKTCTQPKDFLNHRYLRKRAIYLAYVAKCLLGTNLVHSMKFSYQNSSYLKPVLLIEPEGVSNVTVSLSAFPEEGAFKPTRFMCTKNNVRPSWLLGSQDAVDIPTPYYNSHILSDVLLPKLQNYVEELISSQNVKDGIVLVKLWCIQRGLIGGYGRLSGFIISLFVAYLLKEKKINPLLNSYQVFRCVLLNLTNFPEGGITLQDATETPPLHMDEFRKAFEVVFVENSGLLNACFFVTSGTLTMLKHEAKLGLEILNKESPEVFSFLFMKKISFSQKFDYLLHLRGQKFKIYSQKMDLKCATLDFAMDRISAVMPRVCSTLRVGLNNRILLLDVKKTVETSWSVSESPLWPNSCTVTVGFLLNPEVQLSNLEKGPLADDPKAKEFREFWGDISEMRRFQDGTIREAVFWPATTAEDRRKVFSQIVKDILKRHIHAKKGDMQIRGTEVEALLHLPKQILPPDFSTYGTGEEAHVALMHSFDSLCKELRSLSNLPLVVASIQGVSPAFRFSEVFPPLSTSHSASKHTTSLSGDILKLKDHFPGVPPYVPALKFVVNFEGSGKWPDEIEALRRVKVAFLIEIAEALKEKHSLIAIPFLTHTDILKDGFVFRLGIACHKELFLLKQIRMPNGLVKIQENNKSRELELASEVMPKLNSLLHGLHQQHNTYGTACRIAKRWISAQLKHGYIHDVVIELLVAHLYIHPEPHSQPSLPQVAFLRFLALLVSHDWKMSPLIVNLNNELSANEVGEIHSSFNSMRPTLPPMVIVTPFDKRGNMFTRKSPVDLLLQRIQLLASASLEALEKNVCNPDNPQSIQMIFRPPLDSFDVLIYLRRHEIPKLSQAIDIQDQDVIPTLQPRQIDVKDVYPIVDYDPVHRYLEELRANFNEFAYFLYDTYGGDVIAVAWRKPAFVPNEFKVSHANYRKGIVEKGKVTMDVEAILEDFQLLGSSLVKQIVTNIEKWKI